MSERQSSFMERCLAGQVLQPNATIDDEIDRWHENDGFGVELHDWLGMTWDEFRLWGEQPVALRAILAARRTGRPLPEMLTMAQGASALAARGVAAEELATIQQWLRRNGRI